MKNVAKAVKKYKPKSLSLVGGVAANEYIRNEFRSIADRHMIKLIVPKMEYCGDNAAMIAYRGFLLHKNNLRFGLDFNAYPALKGDEFVSL
jgi:N6-L-threonylcarbamoyladenine synthase